MEISEALGWGIVVLLCTLPVYIVWEAVNARRRRNAEADRRISSGAVMGVDEVFHPSGAHAREVWDVEQTLPAPSPIPGDGPGVIDGNRIVIETGLRHEPPRSAEHPDAVDPHADGAQAQGAVPRSGSTV